MIYFSYIVIFKKISEQYSTFKHFFNVSVTRVRVDYLCNCLHFLISLYIAVNIYCMHTYVILCAYIVIYNIIHIMNMKSRYCDINISDSDRHY